VPLAARSRTIFPHDGENCRSCYVIHLLGWYSATASGEEIAGFTRAVGKIARQRGLALPGYRLLLNMGADGGQEVPHLHVHLFGGRSLGRMPSRS
jgi:hypothetical protein